jgi:hypothetical protein
MRFRRDALFLNKLTVRKFEANFPGRSHELWHGSGFFGVCFFWRPFFWQNRSGIEVIKTTIRVARFCEL